MIGFGWGDGVDIIFFSVFPFFVLLLIVFHGWYMIACLCLFHCSFFAFLVSGPFY